MNKFKFYILTVSSLLVYGSETSAKNAGGGGPVDSCYVGGIGNSNQSTAHLKDCKDTCKDIKEKDLARAASDDAESRSRLCEDPYFRVILPLVDSPTAPCHNAWNLTSCLTDYCNSGSCVNPTLCGPFSDALTKRKSCHVEADEAYQRLKEVIEDEFNDCMADCGGTKNDDINDLPGAGSDTTATQ